MTAETPTPVAESQDEVFGKGYKLFLMVAGAVFAVIAISIPMVIIAGNMNFSSGGGSVSSPPVAGFPGEDIAADTGCMACHSTDGTELVGPTWLGLSGSDRELESGETVVADDDYLEESIVDPASQIVKGFQPVMPETYGDQLSSDEISSLIEYINSLG